MATLLEMVSDIVSAHASTSELTTEELVQEITKVHTALKALEEGQPIGATREEEAKPALTVKQAFKKDEIICMVCGKGGMKTITRHLAKAHGMKPGEYRKQFGIPRTQPLAAKSFSESRRAMAQERGLADNLAKAREVRAANLAKAKPAREKAAAVKPKAKAPAKGKGKASINA